MQRFSNLPQIVQTELERDFSWQNWVYTSRTTYYSDSPSSLGADAWWWTDEHDLPIRRSWGIKVCDKFTGDLNRILMTAWSTRYKNKLDRALQNSLYHVIMLTLTEFYITSLEHGIQYTVYVSSIIFRRLKETTLRSC